MYFSVIVFIKAIVLPPTINFVLILLGLSLANRTKFFSRFFLYVGSLSLVLFCLVPFSEFMLNNLEKYPALKLPIIINNEQAIVILGAGHRFNAEEYDKDIDGARALQRNHYGAFLHKQTGLPILVTGGNGEIGHDSEAAVMADTLNDSFNVEVKWQEDKARNTVENAVYSAAILRENEVENIYLVTHAWHMSRAVLMFEKQGIKVTPAPTIFTPHATWLASWQNYIPAASALGNTYLALHEYMGILWYKLKY
ncbi:MAG: uncharacterized SAM-binding protein YcdF (DUF218 family) [Gammaproteobacteria bacterium]|jgi:uncharacterized SAM-binding protein YcdF (DUF218 family)